MRRIYASVLVLGIMGALGLGVVRGLAQTEGPVLTPNQIKPANYSAPDNPMAAAPAVPRPTTPVPEITIPIAAPVPDALPVITPPIPQMPPVSGPRSAPMIEMPPPPTISAPLSPVLAPAPTPIAPIVEPDPIVSPTRPLMVTPKIEPVPAADGDSASLKREPLVTVPAAPPVKPAIPAAGAGPSANRVAPVVSIESIAPDMVRFGQQVAYEIVVRNDGQVPVTHVRVDDELGQGTKLISSLPAGELNGYKVAWMLGALSPGDEKRIKVNVHPGNEGDLSTKPRVTYSASTAMIVRVSRPNLTVTVSAPEAATIGEEVPVHIHVANNGTGDATKVLLKAILSDGLKHPEGNDIQAMIAKLAPGESQNVTLRVQAALPGEQTCSLSAATEGSAKAVKQSRIEVRQPKLDLAVTGPVKCMVRSEPVFRMEVSNAGTCATEPVQLAAAFPEGLDFVSASDGGTYDAASRTVMWNLGPIAASTRRALTVKTKSTSAGHLAVRVVAQGGPKLHARAESIIHAEGVPSLMFDVVDLEDPIEVGKETTYEIRLSNTGSTLCTNVKLTAVISEGLSIGTVSSNVPHKLVGQTLIFDPIAKFPVKADMVIRVKAKGTTPGDQRFKVQMSCDQFKQPVVKEESTSFFQQ